MLIVFFNINSYALSKTLSGIISSALGAIMIVDGASTVTVKTGENKVLEAEWNTITYELHGVYLYNKVTLVTAWDFSYSDTTGSDTYVEKDTAYGSYYDSNYYYHIDYYEYNIHKRYRQDPVLTKKRKSDMEIVGGVALLGVGVYMLLEKNKTIQQASNYLKKHDLALNIGYDNGLTKLLLTKRV